MHQSFYKMWTFAYTASNMKTPIHTLCRLFDLILSLHTACNFTVPNTWLGAIFTKHFVVVIQIWGKVYFASIQNPTVITTKCCTCHDSCTVVASAEICRNMVNKNGSTMNFLKKWFLHEKVLMKSAVAMQCYVLSTVMGRIQSYGWSHFTDGCKPACQQINTCI